MTNIKWKTTRVEHVDEVTGASAVIEQHETGDWFWDVKSRFGVVLKSGCCTSTLSDAKGAAEYAFEKYALGKPMYKNGSAEL